MDSFRRVTWCLLDLRVSDAAEKFCFPINEVNVSTVLKSDRFQQTSARFFKTSHIQADVVSHAAIIPSDEDAWQTAFLAFKHMREGQLLSNIRIWNSCLRGASSAARWFEVLEAMVQLVDQAVEPDSITETLALSALEQSQVWQRALTMTEWLQDSAISLDQLAYSSVSRTHVMSNLWQESMSVLRRYGNKIRLDVVMQNEILDAYEKSAEWRTTLQACSRMCFTGLQQDAVTFCAVMSSCQTRDSWRWMTGMVQHSQTSSQPLDQTCCLAVGKMLCSSVWSIQSNPRMFLLYSSGLPRRFQLSNKCLQPH